MSAFRVRAEGNDSWFARCIGTYAGTIAGGTWEVQRNIIAQRILGLPAR